MPIKTVIWIGPTLKELKAFPRAVQRAVGLAFYATQLGETPPDATPQKEIELIRARLKWAERLYTGQTEEG